MAGNAYSTSSCFFSSYFILTVCWNLTNYTLKHNLLVESSDVILWLMVGKFTGGDSERLCPNNRTYLVFVLRYYVCVSFQQDFTFLRVGKGIFVNRELLVLFPVNCEITFLFLVKRDFGNRREPWFLIIIICETRIGCLFHRELWFSFMLFLIFREKLWLQLHDWSRPALWIRWRLLWWQRFCIRRSWCRASTSKQRTRFPFHSTKNKKRENGEDIKQGSSLAVVLNRSEKNLSYKNVLKHEMPNLLSVKCEMATVIFHETWSIHHPL